MLLIWQLYYYLKKQQQETNFGTMRKCWNNVTKVFYSVFVSITDNLFDVFIQMPLLVSSYVLLKAYFSVNLWYFGRNVKGLQGGCVLVFQVLAIMSDRKAYQEKSIKWRSLM